jgi:hypothetical protein
VHEKDADRSDTNAHKLEALFTHGYRRSARVKEEQAAIDRD